MEYLADEILLHIFKYLEPYDLINIVKANPRFEQLLDEKVLWTWIDTRRKKSSAELAEYFYEKVHEDTNAFMIIANCQEIALTKEQILKWEGFNNLTILALENMHFNGDEFILGNFPHNLEELSLNQSHIENYYRFFRFCSRKLTKLRVLTLEYCLTVEDSILSPLGNLDSLEILSLNGCMAMKDTVVPLTMGCAYGFKKLKVLDVRCTGFGDDLLRYTARMTQLGELYFHCYFDYMIEKKFDSHRNEEKVLQAMEELLNFKNVNITALDYNSVRAKAVKNYFEQFSDHGLINYRKSCFKPEGYEPPKSLLYERPYSICKCKSNRPSTPHPTNGYILTTKEEFENTTAGCNDSTLANSSSSSTPGSSNGCSTSSNSGCRKRSHKDSDSEPNDPPKKAKITTRPNVPSFNDISLLTTFDPFFEFSDGSILRATCENLPQPYPSVFQMSRVISLRPFDRLQVMQHSEEEAGQDLIPVNDREAQEERMPEPAREEHRVTIRVNLLPPWEGEVHEEILRIRDPEPRQIIYYQRINQYSFERQNFIPLTTLSLRGSKTITDEGIKSLQQLQLDLLDVTGTSVTKDGLVALKKLMPACRIIHETMCRCKPR